MEPNDTYQTATVTELLGSGGFLSTTRFDDIGLSGDFVDIFRIPVAAGVLQIDVQIVSLFPYNDLRNQGWYSLNTNISFAADRNATSTLFTIGMHVGDAAHRPKLEAAVALGSATHAAMQQQSFEDFQNFVEDPLLDLDFARYFRIQAIIDRFSANGEGPLDFDAVEIALRAELGQGQSDFAAQLDAYLRALIDVVLIWPEPVYWTETDFDGRVECSIIDTWQTLTLTIIDPTKGNVGLFALGTTDIDSWHSTDPDIALAYDMHATVRSVDPAVLNAPLQGATAGNDLVVAGSRGLVGSLLAGDDRFTGGAVLDIVSGGEGNDLLSGGGGGDWLRGENGDDSLNGGDGSDRIIGFVGKDALNGAAGADAILGGSGNDVLSGGIGIDSLTGGLGRDILIGGAGADLFAFVGVTDSAGTNRDLIRDFEAGLDRIDLRRMDAGAAPGDQALTFIGDLEFTAAGQVRVTTNATSTRIEVSIDGDTDAEMLILLNGVHSLTATDFIL